MLAVQRANMNHLGTLEQHYQDPDQPFGFIFGATDEPAPAPEAPAAGEPLLNDFELSSSNQFFERFQADGGLFDDPKLFEPFDTFAHEPLPNFQGVSSSLGHPLIDSSSPVHTLDFASFGAGDLTSRFGQAQLTSPTSAEHPALSTLHQYPYNPYGPFTTHPKQHRSSSDVFSTQSLFPSPKPPKSRASFGRQSMSSARHNSLSMSDRPAPPTKQGSINYDADTSEDGAFRRRQIPGVNFGTDADFSGQKYAAPGANLKDLQSRDAMIRANLETFDSKWELTDGTNGAGAKPKRRLSGSHPADARRGYAIQHDMDEDEDDDEQPLKRARKLQHDGDGDEASSEEGSPSRTVKRTKSSAGNGKSRTFSDGTVVANGNGAARRKSGLAEAKLPRQNLTEEEKKMNHIRSEQKRRNQIKEGFANLTTMMPDSSAGASKCAILSQAVDWLSGLIEGNAQLRAQLESMR